MNESSGKYTVFGYVLLAAAVITTVVVMESNREQETWRWLQKKPKRKRK